MQKPKVWNITPKTNDKQSLTDYCCYIILCGTDIQDLK